MEPEDVVHALRLLHASLAEGGLVVDTQPVAASVLVSAERVRLGRLDMRQWTDTIAAVDAGVEEAVATGLFRLRHEEFYVTHDVFDDPEELLETVSNWRGTEVPDELAPNARAAAPPFRVEQHVRLRLFERLN